MIGQLQMFYKNGEIRIVKLDTLFFREQKLSIATRALDIAFSHNPEPWKIYVFKETEVKFEKVISGNEPYKRPVNLEVNPNLREKRSLVKKFKKEFKAAA
jgi:hypothetical protein